MKSVIEKMDNLINIEKIYSFYDDIGSLYAQNNNGEIYAWGNNSDGVLGIGNDSDEWIGEPVKINGLTNVEELYFFGGYNVYAKTSTGMVYFWGSGDLNGGEKTSIPICLNNIRGFLKDNNAKIKCLQCAYGEYEYIYIYINRR